MTDARHRWRKATSRVLSETFNLALIALGILSAGMGLLGFLLPSNFIDGGVTGVSMLLAGMTTWPLSIWLCVVNLPFIAIGFRHLGGAFAVRSVLAISGLALAVVTIPYPVVTHDMVLTAVFGGFFLGAGIGLAVRGGAVMDGTEIAALLISRRFRILRVGDVILGFNAVLFLTAMSILGVEPALYSILAYITAAKTLDFVIYGLEEYTAITIVSAKSAAIREAVTGTLGRGVTVLLGRGGMAGGQCDILYCVVTRLEISRVRSIIRRHDESAFVTFHSLADVEGGIVKKIRIHQ